MLQYLFLVLAIPLGLLLAGLTKDEKSIYQHKRYFPLILEVLISVSIIMYFFDKAAMFASIFMFITIFVWYKK